MISSSLSSCSKIKFIRKIARWMRSLSPASKTRSSNWINVFTLVLTNCTNLASVIDASSGSEVNIKLKSSGQLFYERTIPFVPNKRGTKLKYKENSPEKHRDALLLNKERIKIKIRNVELGSILNEEITVEVEVGGYTYQLKDIWTMKDKPDRAKYTLEKQEWNYKPLYEKSGQLILHKIFKGRAILALPFFY